MAKIYVYVRGHNNFKNGFGFKIGYFFLIFIENGNINATKNCEIIKQQLNLHILSFR